MADLSAALKVIMMVMMKAEHSGAWWVAKTVLIPVESKAVKRVDM